MPTAGAETAVGRDGQRRFVDGSAVLDGDTVMSTVDVARWEVPDVPRGDMEVSSAADRLVYAMGDQVVVIDHLSRDDDVDDAVAASTASSAAPWIGRD